MATDSANYSNWILTRRFAELETQAAQTADKIEWGRMLASSDTIPVENLPNMTDNNMRTLNAKQTVQVSDVYVNQNTVTITGVFDSNHNPSEYLVNTIFLTARYKGVEFLAASCVAKGYPMRMPRSTQEQYTTFTVKAQVILATSNSVSTRIDPTTPATNERVDKIEEKVNQRLNQFTLDYNTLKGRVEVNEAKNRQQDTTIADHERRIADNTRNLVREPRVNELIGQAKNELNRSLERVEGKIPINVGGRNLLLNTREMSIGSGLWSSGTFRKSGSGTIQTIDISDGPVQGSTKGIRLTSSDSRGQIGITQDSFKIIPGYYTVSYWIKGQIGQKIRLQVWWMNDSEGMSPEITLQSNDWTRLSYTAQKEGKGVVNVAYVYLVNAAVGSYIDVLAPQLEFGELVSDYQPAPEDAEETIRRLENSTTRNFQEQGRRLTDVDGPSGRLKQVEDSVRDTDVRLRTQIENTKTSGVNLIRNSRIAESSNVYGFGKRTVSLVAGKTYWFLARAKKTGGVADKLTKIYLYFPNWSQEVSLTFHSTEYEIKSAKFIPNHTGIYEIISYWHPNGGDRTGQADIDWYMVVESDLCPTTWSPAPEDAEQILEVIKPFVEFQDGGVRRDLNDIRDNSNLSWYLKPRELLHNPFVSNTSNTQHWFTVETRLVAENVYSQRFMCLDGTFPPAYRMYNRGTWTTWKGYI